MERSVLADWESFGVFCLIGVMTGGCLCWRLARDHQAAHETDTVAVSRVSQLAIERSNLASETQSVATAIQSREISHQPDRVAASDSWQAVHRSTAIVASDDTRVGKLEPPLTVPIAPEPEPV